MQRIPGRAIDITFFLSIILLAVFMAWIAPAYAAPIAKMPEAGCEGVGTVGTVIIAHCVDKSGNEFEQIRQGCSSPWATNERATQVRANGGDV